MVDRVDRAMSGGADERGYEFENPPVKGLFIALGGLGVTLAVILVVVIGVYRVFADLRAPEVPSSRVPLETSQKFPGPRLQIDPSQDWQELHDRQQRELHTYGWVDPDRRIVRVPIDRAFEMLLQRNDLPVRGEPTERKPTKTPLDLQRERAEERTPDGRNQP